jgi:two-component system chemotaxis response regulator CheB
VLLPRGRRDHLNAASPPAGAAPIRFGVVVIGASAGGVPALAVVLGALPREFPVPVAVVLHLSPDHPSVLADVLARFTTLDVKWAASGVRVRPGTVYVAPPDHHFVFRRDTLTGLRRSARVQHARPSVDRLFATAAHAFGARTLAVILTGNGHDGSDGVREVHRLGGVVIAQDAASSEYFSMPGTAIESGGVTFVCALDRIAPMLRHLAALGVQPVPTGQRSGNN